MRRKTTLIVVAGAAALTLGATGTWAAGAATGSGSHTLKFTSVQTSEKDFGYRFVDADRDVHKGKVIGYDVVNGVFYPKANKFSVDFAGSLRNGILYGHGVGSGSSSKFHGTIDGGTRAYRGARGTVTGRSFGSEDQNEKLVFVFHH